MTQTQTDIGWKEAPIPLFWVDGIRILDCNERALALLECSLSDLVGNEDWPDRIFGGQAQKLLNKLAKSGKKFLACEITTFAGNKKFIQIKQNDEGNFLVFIDLTELHEDTLVLQAGYDEFIDVTMELEKALSTIETQKTQLVKQKGKLENELKLARKVQTQVYSVDFAGFDLVNVAGYYEAMDDLGGDMWHFHQTQDSFVVVIGDVMGHGVAASLISIAAKAMFQNQIEATETWEKTLAEICTKINRELIEITQGDYYITIAAIKVDTSNQIEYITCGHPPMLLCRKDPKQEERHVELFITQPMLGIFSGLEYESHKVDCDPGDRVLLFTDCLVESLNEAGQPISEDKIFEILSQEHSPKPDDVIQNMLKYHKEFTNDAPRSDDMALVCIETRDLSS